ncbi:23S rRNA (uracil(1939)-C(5))-methyltransferase RlmD [Facklamia miroungae]|uniref:23S rRNA (Uracil1939-C5)-methyltransferase n=1 Tax=Facklamia miroungae TaxID=120956 RepID=A0A1G7TBG8_9LACT|nr:23S rRNA (uracil(1939)-C(5))-methyltransferase RlmD [Facklamia miroungae]NKZ29744.1 23S rRNA (uracil(1939)-C(5))-methyltransferase RlmD [Facklamia miroungae]SDG32452.1 23S rRNA (uracil1939-C5)-methyltransferase [Facklamia miroungae]
MKKEIYPTEILEVKITGLDHKGNGYARYVHPPDRGSNGKGLKLFIPNAVPGDKVRVTVPNAKGRKQAVVSFDELLEASPDRNPDIPIKEANAGGTPLISMTYPAQLAYKTQEVKDHLESQGFDPACVRPIIGMDDPTRYRNKMELTFGAEGAIGMHEQGNFTKIIDMKDSVLAPKLFVEVKEVVAEWQQDYQLSYYDKQTQTGLLRNLLLRQSFVTDELMVVIYATQAPSELSEAVADLSQRLSQRFYQLASLQWILHKEATERIQADETHILYGRDYIKDELNGFRYRIWPETFFQANPIQAEKLVQIALEIAQVNNQMRVLDLFCGVGTFSLPLAERAKDLAGIEIVDQSIQSAIRNARDNGLDNTFFMTSDARNGLKRIDAEWGRPDLLLLDPPRSGAGGKVMRAIGRFGTDKIIYVSCFPKSLAEDLGWLRDYGYELVSVQPVDQFPHTTHVECVVLMEKMED